MENNSFPPTSENKLDRLRDKMNELKVSYPTNKKWLKQFAIATSEIGNLRDCKFYVSDKNTKRGIAFSVAYNEAKRSKNNTELCASVASMICDVSTGFTSSVEAALEGISVRLVEVRLPSEACEHNIVVAKVPLMDWPSMLVYFGCCILLLFKKSTDEAYYKTFMISCIRKMREIAGCDPDAKLDVPFDFQRANAIRTMLGVSSKLRADAIKFLVSNIDSEDTGIGGVCQYLCNKLSWSQMRAFTLMNDVLVKPQSPVLLDPRVSREVDNLMDACAAIASHPCPQFFMHLASKGELSKVEPSRFPTLIEVALEISYNNGLSVANSESISTAATDPTTVRALVKLHRTDMPQKRFVFIDG